MPKPTTPWTRNRPYESLLLASIGAVALGAVLVAAAVVAAETAMALVAMLVYLVVLLAAALLFVLSRHRGLLEDLRAAVSLEATLARWGASPPAFFYDGAAASPTLQLVHAKILILTEPRAVLELGSGQTTKLLSHYAAQSPDRYALTLEEDPAWAARLSASITHDLRVAPLAPVEWDSPRGGRRRTIGFTLPDDARGRRFNYVLVDGPNAASRGADGEPVERIGIVAHLPDILADSFVVVFDDAERRAEQDAADELAARLAARQIPHRRFRVRGTKTQEVLCSPDLAYLASA